MTKFLARHGNSYAVVLDKPILDLLNISLETPLDISTNGEQLIISPVRKTRRIQASLKRMDRRYGNMLKGLAK